MSRARPAPGVLQHLLQRVQKQGQLENAQKHGPQGEYFYKNLSLVLCVSLYQLGKQYPCSYCGKILYSSQYVKKHEATHTGQKFKGVNCKYCGKLVEYTKVKTHDLKILQFVST